MPLGLPAGAVVLLGLLAAVLTAARVFVVDGRRLLMIYLCNISLLDGFRDTRTS